MFLCMSPHTCTLPRLVFSSLHSNGETDMDAVRQEMIEMRRAVLREVDTNQVRMHLLVCGGGEGACVCVCVCVCV